MQYIKFLIISLPAFLYYYFGDFRVIALISYLFALVICIYDFSKERGLEKGGILFFLGALFILYSLIYENTYGLIYAFRLNFGFILFIVAFQSVRTPKVESIALILALLTIVEFLIITIFPFFIELLPNYNNILAETFSTVGVHSFGGNRTVTGVLLLSIYIYLEQIQEKSIVKQITLLASMLCGSGTAYALLLVYIGFKGFNKIKYLIAFFGCAVLFLIFEYNKLILLEKFNIDYIKFLLDYKFDQIKDLNSRMQVESYFFGIGNQAFGNPSLAVDEYGSLYGDFLLLDFMARYGILGIISLLYFIFCFTNKISFIPILIIALGTLHYHVLFSTPGQVIVAVLIVDSIKRVNLNVKLN